MIQRAYTFTNYAGRFLYVEAHNKLHGDTTGPAMSFTYTGPNGTSQVDNLSNSSISPDGDDAALGGNKIADGDAGAGARYMYHRGLVALRGADANLQAGQITVRVADATGNFDTSGVDRVGRQGPAAARRRLPEGLHHEVHGPDRDLHPDGPARRAVPGHHRGHRPAEQDRRLPASGMAMMAAHRAGNGNAERGQTTPARST